MVARLHHELVAGAAARQWMIMTHGIFGSGANWRTIARQLVTRRPEWGAVLVDLRLHGRSDAGQPPHTIAACAGDLAALCEQLGSAGTPIRVAAGHSFGGKVVLELRARQALTQAWVFDSTPSARPGEWDAPGNTVRAVWDALRAHDRAWAQRSDFVAALVATGLATSLAQWLAMNLVSTDDGLRLRFDLAAIRDLLLDYYRIDLWPAVETETMPGEVRAVIATRSSALSAADRERFAVAARRPRVGVDYVDTGHWLHLDAPAAVVELLASGLSAD